MQSDTYGKIIKQAYCFKQYRIIKISSNLEVKIEIESNFCVQYLTDFEF